MKVPVKELLLHVSLMGLCQYRCLFPEPSYTCLLETIVEELSK
jgi:hypothetical protein